MEPKSIIAIALVLFVAGGLVFMFLRNRKK